MKKLFIIFPIIFLLITPVASAHVLKSDGAIGIQLHLDPDDDPIINKPANFDFQISDKDKKFAFSNCNCSVAILKDGQQVFSTPLSASGAGSAMDSAMFSYTFTQKAVYNVIVSGTPKTPHTFQPFTIQFDLRISREDTSALGGKTNPWLVAIFVIVAIVVGGVVFYKRK